MASFNPQIQDTGLPDMTGNSRGTGADRTFETLFSGLTNTAENVTKIKDTATQLDIQDQASKIFDQVNQEFGVDAPAGMTDGLDQIQVLKNALDQGKLSEVNYYGRLATLSKQLRSRYPGYEHIVDSTIQSVTGTRPANAYRDAILHEFGRMESEATDQARYQRRFEDANSGEIATLFPDYFENPGKYSFDDVRAKVAQYSGRKTQIEGRLQDLQLRSRQNDFNEKLTKKTIDQDFSFITQSFLTAAVNANDPSYEQRINEFVAKGGGTPEETRQFIDVISQAETTLRQQLYSRGQKEYVSHGILSADDVNKAIDNAMYPLAKAKEAVLGGDFKLAQKYATLNKVIEDQQANDLFKDPDIRIGAGLSKINNDLGASWFADKQDDIFGRVNDNRSNLISEEIVGRVLNGDPTLMAKTVHEGDSGLTKAALNKSYAVLNDPNATPENIHSIVESIFGKNAVNWMDRRVVDPADMETLYQKFLDPKTTRAIFSKGSEEDKKTYLDWATTSARAIPEFAKAAGDFNSINSNLKGWQTGIQLSLDPKTMRVTATSDRGPEYAQKAAPLIGRQVNALNKVFSVLGPIIEASGENKEEAARQFIRSLSINLDGVDPESKGPEAEDRKGFWSWMYDGLTSPVGTQSDETRQETFDNLTKVPEVVQDVGSAVSQIGSDLMTPVTREGEIIPEVEAEDSGDIDFIFQKPEETKLTEQTTRAASSPITGAWEEFRDAKTPLELASKFDGLSEKRDRDVISSFIEKAAGVSIDPAKTAWCAAFVNAVLGAKGMEGTGRLNARSFLDWGTPVKTPSKGDIVVLERNGSTWQGHVGFLVSEDKNSVTLLGGNQGNRVSVKSYPKSRVLGYRRP